MVLPQAIILHQLKTRAMVVWKMIPQAAFVGIFTTACPSGVHTSGDHFIGDHPDPYIGPGPDPAAAGACLEDYLTDGAVRVVYHHPSDDRDIDR